MATLKSKATFEAEGWQPWPRLFFSFTVCVLFLCINRAGVAMEGGGEGGFHDYLRIPARGFFDDQLLKKYEGEDGPCTNSLS